MKIFVLFLLVCCALQTQAQTFTANPNAFVPDNGPVTAYPLAVSGLPDSINAAFGLESVCLDMLQTWDADMAVWIQAPDGSTVLLFQGVGGDGDNFDNTCLDGVSASIATGTAPFNGSFKAMGTLGALNNNQNPNGTWNLLCQDQGTWDFAFLSTWSLTFGANPAEAFTLDSSRLPLVYIDTDGEEIHNSYKIPATFKIIDNGPGQWNYTAQTTFAYTGHMAVEYQGFTGPSYPKKNYDFNVTDSNGLNVDTPLLGMPSENDWILKSEYTDASLINNSLTYHMARRMGRYAPRTMYCEVFLNGDYIGVYNLTEKVKRGAQRVNIAKLKTSDTSGVELTGGYIIEMNHNGNPAAWFSAYAPVNDATTQFDVEFKHVYPRADSIQPQQHAYIKNFVDSFENVLASAAYQDPVNGFRKYAAESSFVDFMIVNEFSANYDSYGRSTFMFKEKATDGGKLHIGPAWDYDRAYAPWNVDGWVHELTHPYWPFPFWWSKFRQDTVFMRKVHCRWHSLRENTLRTDSFHHYIDSVSAFIYDAALRNYVRWGEQAITDYDAQVNALKDFVTARNAWVDAALPDTGIVPLSLALSDVAFCAGDTVTVHSGLPGLEHQWSNGAYTDSLNLTQPGGYALTVANPFGCSASVSFNAAVMPQPDATFTWTDLGSGAFAFAGLDSAAVDFAWNFGNGLTSNETNPVVLLSDSLNVVALTVTGTNGCTNAFVDTVHVYLATLDLSDNARIALYPNPTSGRVFVSTANTWVETTQIVDASGRVVLVVPFDATLDVSSLAPGVYEVRWLSKNGLVGRTRLAKI